MLFDPSFHAIMHIEITRPSSSAIAMFRSILLTKIAEMGSKDKNAGRES